MGKWFGKIGFGIDKVVRPGVFKKEIVEKEYYGDIVRNNRRLQPTEYVNDDITISNEFSILADPFASQNFHSMLYIEYMGAKWKISSVDVQFPRLILSIGGIYNGSHGPKT